MKRIKATQVVPTVSYGFLESSKALSQNHFYINNDFSKNLYKQLFKETKTTSQPVRETVDYLESFYASEFGVHRDSKIMEDKRVEALHKSLSEVTYHLSIYGPLLAEIQNEYRLVITALKQVIHEKAYLASKIQRLMVNDPTEIALNEAKARILYWNAKWELALKRNQKLHSQTREEEFKFVTWVGDIYTAELAKTRDEKRKKDLMYLGRWRFIKDWISERAENDPTVMALYQILLENPEPFRNLFSEDEEIQIHEYDTVDVRKLKNHVSEQKKIYKHFMKEITTASTKRDGLASQISIMDEKILGLTEALKSQFGTTQERWNDDS